MNPLSLMEVKGNKRIVMLLIIQSVMITEKIYNIYFERLLFYSQL